MTLQRYDLQFRRHVLAMAKGGDMFRIANELTFSRAPP